MSTLQAQGAQLSDTDYASFPVYIPDSVKFQPTRQGLAARRIPVKIRSEQQTYSSNNNKLVRFILPNNALYDTRSGYLTFEITITTTGGTYKRMHTGIFSAVNRLRVLCASTEVEDLRDYNRIYSALWEMSNVGSVTSAIGVTTMGFGTTVQRNALGATASAQYACPLFSGVLNTELLPFDNLSTGMVLELYLEDGLRCVETDGTNPQFTLSNAVFHMERLELDPSYRSFISSYIRQNGLQLGFHTWERYISALTTGTVQHININHRSSSMNGMLNFLIDSSKLGTTTENDKFLTWLPLSLVSTSTLINGTIFPDEPIDTVYANRVEPYQMYCRWVQKWKLNGFLDIAPAITNLAFADNRFVQIDDLEPYPEVVDIINPFSTLSNNSTITKKLIFSSTVPDNYQLDTWVEYFRQIAILSNGNVKVIQ